MSILGAARPGAPLFDDAPRQYDAVLVLSFGGPEGPDEVMPFLENVTRGRNIPPQRLTEVAAHYHHFGGVSPINAQNRSLIAALERELSDHGLQLPVYFGNRNWRPFLADTISGMRAEGVRDVLVFVTSAYCSYSGCRQYREDIMRALDRLGLADMRFDKLRVFYNHPGFILPMASGLRAALDAISVDQRERVEVVFTAHSIPLAMARGSAYERQVRESSRLVAEYAGANRYQVAWQSRSGPPQVPWLEPDVLQVLDTLHAEGAKDVILVPVGFISDHLEVLYDLDYEACERAQMLDMNFVRVPTVGTRPEFVTMIRELIEERLTSDPPRRFLGTFGPGHDVCPINCCLSGASPSASSANDERATA